MRSTRTRPNRTRGLVALLAAAVAAAGVAAAAPAAVAAPAAATASTTQTDHVLDWNNVLLGLYRTASGPYGAPGPLARAGAMMHAAIWDAENSVVGGPTPAYGFFNGRVAADAGASPEAAIDQAAHDTLMNAFPTQGAVIDAAFNTERGTIPAGVTQAQKDAARRSAPRSP